MTESTHAPAKRSDHLIPLTEAITSLRDFSVEELVASGLSVTGTFDRQRGRLEAIRFVLHCLDYPDRDDDVVGSPDSLIVGPPEVVAADAGENLPLSRSPER